MERLEWLDGVVAPRVMAHVALRRAGLRPAESARKLGRAPTDRAVRDLFARSRAVIAPALSEQDVYMIGRLIPRGPSYRAIASAAGWLSEIRRRMGPNVLDSRLSVRPAWEIIRARAPADIDRLMAVEDLEAELRAAAKAAQAADVASALIAATAVRSRTRKPATPAGVAE